MFTAACSFIAALTGIICAAAVISGAVTKAPTVLRSNWRGLVFPELTNTNKQKTTILKSIYNRTQIPFSRIDIRHDNDEKLGGVVSPKPPDDTGVIYLGLAIKPGDQCWLQIDNNYEAADLKDFYFGLERDKINYFADMPRFNLIIGPEPPKSEIKVLLEKVCNKMMCEKQTAAKHKTDKHDGNQGGRKETG